MISSKYNRSKFLDSFNNGDEKEAVLDSDYWKLFKMTRTPTIYTVNEIDVSRWDILSARFYGDSQYYWIILKANNIIDPWNDIEKGDDIIIPDKRDIFDFYTNVKNNKRK